MKRLQIIAEAYRKMPYGGAALTVDHHGNISNGMAIVSRYPSKRAAERALRIVGFSEVSYGWKLRK